MTNTSALPQIADLFEIIPLEPLRRTPGVWFDLIPQELVEQITAVDRVLHENGAISPHPIGNIARPWYMHPHQEDHLLVLHGSRTVELFTHPHGRIETLLVTPNRVDLSGQLLYDGPCLVKWPCNVFHRIESSATLGSASLNFAHRYPGFDLRTNFNIYDLNPETGQFTVIREGHRDQPQAQGPSATPIHSSS